MSLWLSQIQGGKVRGIERGLYLFLFPSFYLSLPLHNTHVLRLTFVKYDRMVFVITTSGVKTIESQI